MSAYGATARWSSTRPVDLPEVRLTRRGRLARAAALAVIAGLLSLSMVDTFAGPRALADDAPATPPVSTQSVVVDPGDSLWSIATTVAPSSDPRETIHAIRELNGLRSSLLQPGQVLLIPATL